MQHSLPSLQQAEDFLAEGNRLNPGPWVQHSRYVGQGAQIIAEYHPDLDPERAYILGLLHDIGRRFGIAGMRHCVDGYRFLADLGYEDPARICLTHSYPVFGLMNGASPWDGSEEDRLFLTSYLSALKYTDYDRIIQLCDALALPSGFCLLEKRLVDVVIRYGADEFTTIRWKAYFRIKDQIENAIGKSVYQLLPNIVENTFERQMPATILPGQHGN